MTEAEGWEVVVGAGVVVGVAGVAVFPPPPSLCAVCGRAHRLQMRGR